MSSVIKALIIALAMNICLTIVGISLGGNDALSQFISINGDTVSPTGQFNLGGNDSAIPTTIQTSVGISSSSSGLSFVDTVVLTFRFIALVLIGVFLPVYWGFALSLPLWLTLLLTLQTIFGITAVILAIRGVSS